MLGLSKEEFERLTDQQLKIKEYQNDIENYLLKGIDMFRKYDYTEEAGDIIKRMTLKKTYPFKYYSQ